MKQYVLSKAARQDLAEIREYLRERGGRDVAARVLRKLRDATRRLAEMPGIGHLRPDLASESLRFYRVFQYLIIYRPDAHPLAVVRVLHGAGDVKSILGEA